MAGILGGGEGFRGVLLVEDAVAKELAIALLEEVSPDTLRQFDVTIAGGTGGVSAALQSFPKTGKWLSIVGAYDGDARNTINNANHKWPHIFLPSDQPPELMLQTAVKGANGVALVCQEFKVSKEAVLPALEAVVGLNPHDWLVECAVRLGLSREQFVRGLTRIWLSEAATLDLATQFANDLQDCYNA